MNNNLNSFCKFLTENPEFYVLDTETTGLHDGEICQIAIIDHDGNTIFYDYVRTKEPIPTDATDIHGITNEMVSSAATFQDLASGLQRTLKGKPVVIYNAVYDRKMLHRSAERWGMEHIAWKEISIFLCAMEAYAEFFGDWNAYHGNYRWQPLTRAAQNCGVRVLNAHDALGDCRMTLGVVKHMLKWYSEHKSTEAIE